MVLQPTRKSNQAPSTTVATAFNPSCQRVLTFFPSLFLSLRKDFQFLFYFLIVLFGMHNSSLYERYVRWQERVLRFERRMDGTRCFLGRCRHGASSLLGCSFSATAIFSLREEKCPLISHMYGCMDVWIIAVCLLGGLAPQWVGFSRDSLLNYCAWM